MPWLVASTFDTSMKTDGIKTKFPNKYRREMFVPATAITMAGAASIAGTILGYYGIKESNERKLAYGAGLYTVGSMMAIKGRLPLFALLYAGVEQAVDDAGKTVKKVTKMTGSWKQKRPQYRKGVKKFVKGTKMKAGQVYSI